jgi:hypothetical protein
MSKTTIGDRLLNAIDAAITGNPMNAAAGKPAQRELGTPDVRSIFEPPAGLFTKINDDGNNVRRRPKLPITPQIVALISQSREVKSANKAIASELRAILDEIKIARDTINGLASEKVTGWSKHLTRLGNKVLKGDREAEPARTRKEFEEAIRQRIDAAKFAAVDPSRRLHKLTRPVYSAAVQVANTMFRNELALEQDRAAKFGVPFEASEILLTLNETARRMQEYASTPEPTGACLHPDTTLFDL